MRGGLLVALACDWRWMLLGATLACGLAGCGAEVYEQRLKETEKYFKHLNALEAALGPAWVDPQLGLEIRPARQFVQIPAPEPPAESEDDAPGAKTVPKALPKAARPPSRKSAPARKNRRPPADESEADADESPAEESDELQEEDFDEEEDEEPETDEGEGEEGGEARAEPDEKMEDRPPAQGAAGELYDERQPHYVEGLVLPGLAAAWRAEVSVSNDSERRTAYFYVLSTKAIPEEEHRDEAYTDFYGHLPKLLAAALEIEAPAGADVSFPSGETQVDVVNYTLFEFEHHLEDSHNNYSLYLWKGGDTPVAVLAVVPEGAGTSDELYARIDLSLETLRVYAPAGFGGTPAEPGQPATGGKTAF